ncbi:MAG: NADH-quinone oxidoreductase subunit H [Candidatus Omnitrophica bacterium]|nr:NADH-quinone oxidoreductase subunit H [Candidatus Omnitrophota bacterium]MDD5436464.1 NADH-quinone oxidoreductase subunit H [Candidatus Omnitrophota bacterium]
MLSIFYILIFPGFLFLSAFGLAAQFVDRKLCARLQNRVGPPWFQPLADFIKLSAKEDIIPEEANPSMFKLMPVLAITAAITAIFYIPLWSVNPIYAFSGDLIVVLYLLTIPTLTFFLGGWYSTSLYSRIGAVRALTQLFAYEVPLLMSILAPALLADTWSLKEMSLFYSAHPFFWLFNILGFAISMIALLGKLEKVPFDIPEAETEIVGGTFTEYSGRLLALFRLGIDIEQIVGAALLAAVYLPFGLGLGPVAGFLLFVLKVLTIVCMLSILRTIFARLRIDQMISFCWKCLAPLAFIQLFIDLVLKGFIVR